MRRPLSELRDKLYWRDPAGTGQQFHCFKRLEGSGGRPAECRSLCGSSSIPRSGGQASGRPEQVLRCGRCDLAEMRRRGWDEPGPTLVRRVLSRRDLP